MAKQKKFELISFANADELAARVANLWLDEIKAANSSGKNFCVALSGGRIAQKFFAKTVQFAAARKISFDGVHFFWADERCVPPTDPESNFKLANELLFSPLKISAEKIHRLRGEIPPEAALKIAETELRQFALIENGWPVLDLIFLGMGEDGHVASLFQNAGQLPQNEANCNSPFIFVDNSPKPPPRRISLSFNAIATAKAVWVLASGIGKENALKESLRVEGQTPLARVIQLRSLTKVFSDVQDVVTNR